MRTWQITKWGGTKINERNRGHKLEAGRFGPKIKTWATRSTLSQQWHWQDKDLVKLMLEIPRRELRRDEGVWCVTTSSRFGSQTHGFPETYGWKCTVFDLRERIVFLLDTHSLSRQCWRHILFFACTNIWVPGNEPSCSFALDAKTRSQLQLYSTHLTRSEFWSQQGASRTQIVLGEIWSRGSESFVKYPLERRVIFVF